MCWALFYLLYILCNDLPECVLSNLYIFADDTKLYRAIKSKDDCDILQQDLYNATDW